MTCIKSSLIFPRFPPQTERQRCAEFQTSSPSSPDWIVLCSLTSAQMAQQSWLPLPRVPDGELSVHPAAGECFAPALSQKLKGEEQERVQ